MNEESPGHRADLAAGFGRGSRLGGYRLEEQVGAGGMAVVFRAHDERLDRLVALKIMTPAMGSDDMFRQRFIRESRAAAAVEDPHIIPVYEAGEAGHLLFIAMRLVRGGDVRSLLRRDGPLTPERVASIVSPVASALDAAHAAGLVHRDVKPANILLDRRPGRPDHVYLSDFGLSKSAEVSLGLTAAGQFLGTPDYTAPEQIEGLPVDGRTDQYALACAVFELLTGQAPFHRSESFAAIWAHLNRPPPSLAERRPELPPAVDHVMARALAKAQVDRYKTCWEFADALRDALGLPPYHLGSASDPGLARPGSTPGQEDAGPTPGQDVPRRAALRPPVPPVSPSPGPVPSQELEPSPDPAPSPDSAPPPGPAPSPGLAPSPEAAADMDVLPPGQDTEASEIFVVRSPAMNWHRGQPAADSQPSTPDDQATDPGRQVIPPEPASLEEDEEEPSSPGQEASAPAGQPAVPAEEPAGPAGESGGRAGKAARPAREVGTPAPEPAGTPAPEAAGTPAGRPAGTPAEPPAGSPAPKASAPPPKASSAPAPKAAARSAQPAGAVPDQPRVSPRRPAPPHSWPSTPPRTPRPRPGPPRRPAGPPGTPAGSSRTPPGGPERPPGRTRRGQQPGRRRAASLALIGAGILAAAGVAVVLIMVVTAHFLGSPGGRRDVTPSAYSRDFFPPHVAGILSSVAFSPDGKTLSAGATGGPTTGSTNGPQPNGITYLWNVRSGNRVASFSPGGGAEAFSPDGQLLAAAGGPGNSTTYLWQVATGHKLATLADHQSSMIQAVAFSANGRMLAVNHADGTVHVWTLTRSHGVARGYSPASVSLPGVASNTLAFSPQGSTLAMGGSDGQVYLWSEAVDSVTRTLSTPGNSGVTSVAFSPDGQAVAAGETDGVTYVWHLPSQSRRPFADPDSLGVESVAFSPDGKRLATGDRNGRTYLWNLATGKLAETLTNPKGPATGPLSSDLRTAVFSVAFSPNGTTLATTDTNGHAYLWKVGRSG